MYNCISLLILSIGHIISVDFLLEAIEYIILFIYNGYTHNI